MKQKFVKLTSKNLEEYFNKFADKKNKGWIYLACLYNEDSLLSAYSGIYFPIKYNAYSLDQYKNTLNDDGCKLIFVSHFIKHPFQIINSKINIVRRIGQFWY